MDMDMRPWGECSLTNVDSKSGNEAERIKERY